MSFKQFKVTLDKAQVTESKESFASRMGGLEGAGPMDGPVYNTKISYNGMETKTKTQNVQFMMGEFVPVIVIENQSPEILYDKLTPYTNQNMDTVAQSMDKVGAIPDTRLDTVIYKKKSSLFGGGKIKKMKKAMLAGMAGQTSSATIIGRDARDGMRTEVNGRLKSATIICTLTLLIDDRGEQFVAQVPQKIKWKAKDVSEFYRLGTGTAVGMKVNVAFDPDNKSNVVITGMNIEGLND